MSSIYWLNKDSRTFLSRGYLLPDITPEKRIRQIAEASEKILRIKNFADKFEYYMHKGWYSLSSPIWSNFGAERGLPISCYGSYVEDTMDSILYKHAEVGKMTKYGGGTSVYLGDLRGRGASISDGTKSSGPIHFARLFDSVTDVVSQSSVRRGSCAVYLPVDHPDIEEFLQFKKVGNAIQNLSFGVCITDKWMEQMISGDKDKLKIWGKIIERKFDSGYPYIFFTDTVNRNAPKVYKDKNLKIYASNLCVTGDQRVVSNYGLLTAKELYEIGNNLELFDNQNIIQSSPMKLIEKNADIYKITLENGLTHKITNYHQISVRNSRDRKGRYLVRDKACKDLKIGDYAAFQTKKGIFGNLDMQNEAFLLGLYQADGTQHEDDIMLDVWEPDFDLIPEIKTKFDDIYFKYKCNQPENCYRTFNAPDFQDCIVNFSPIKKKRLISRCLKRALNFEKGYIPDWIWKSNEKTQWEYIRGLYFADGTVNITHGKGDPFYLSISNINKKFLEELQILLLNLGITSSLSFSAKAGKKLLPDGKGGKKYYDTKDCFRLVTGNKNDGIQFEKNTGFISRKGLKFDKDYYRDNTKKFAKIKSIEFLGKEDVFCCEVNSDIHHWICNGFITHNCSEIMLHSSEDQSFVCDLSSMNLLHYNDWKNTDAVEILTYFLDSVMTEFIDKVKDKHFMKSALNFALKQRALGVGVLGWHSLLQSKMLSFDAMEAKFLNIEIHRSIRDKSIEASKKMAVEYGEPELLKGYGMRNVTTMAIAPTTSSSFILGQVSQSIEPLESNYFVNNLAKGKFSYKNPYLKEVLKKHDKDNSDTWNSILSHNGSVQHLKFLSSNEKNVFKTFLEISQKEIVIQAAARQKYIDQSQSLNIKVGKVNPKNVSDLLVYGWENGIKTFYYQRNVSATKELQNNIMECKSCES